MVEPVDSGPGLDAQINVLGPSERLNPQHLFRPLVPHLRGPHVYPSQIRGQDGYHYSFIDGEYVRGEPIAAEARSDIPDFSAHPNSIYWADTNIGHHVRIDPPPEFDAAPEEIKPLITAAVDTGVRDLYLQNLDEISRNHPDHNVRINTSMYLGALEGRMKQPIKITRDDLGSDEEKLQRIKVGETDFNIVINPPTDDVINKIKVYSIL